MSRGPTKPVKAGDTIELSAAALVFGGEAVGRYEGFTVFVPGALPGERARVRVMQVKDSYARGELVELLQPSPDRTAPECPIFEECGGCQWQQIEYGRQLQTKRQFVSDALGRIGHFQGLAVQPCLPSPDRYAYRNKAMPVLSMRDGHFVTGIFEPRSHKLVPYVSCPIQSEPLNQLIQRALKKVELAGLTPYQDKPHTGFLRHLAVRHGFSTGELMLAFVTRTEVPEERLHRSTLLPEPAETILPRIAEELMRETPNLVSVLQNVNPARTNLVLGPVTKTLAGRSYYHEVIDSLLLKVSLKSFLQVNSRQAEILHAVVREALGRPADPRKKHWEIVLDLYSGIGTLALAVSQRADYVLGVEELAPAVADAQENAKLNHRKNVDFAEGDVGAALLHLKEKGLSRVDAVIVDPPRKGVLPEVLARVAALQPERLVYVSCDPATLARDLEMLSKHGFSVDWVQPLDMFPQTYHVETVVRLTRNTPLVTELIGGRGEEKKSPFRLRMLEERPEEAREPLAPPVREAVAYAVRKSAEALQGLFLVGKALFFTVAGATVKGSALALRGSLAVLRGAGKAALIPVQQIRSAVLRWQERREQHVFVPPPPPLEEPLPVESITPPDFLEEESEPEESAGETVAEGPALETRTASPPVIEMPPADVVPREQALSDLSGQDVTQAPERPPLVPETPVPEEYVETTETPSADPLISSSISSGLTAQTITESLPVEPPARQEAPDVTASVMAEIMAPTAAVPIPVPAEWEPEAPEAVAAVPSRKPRWMGFIVLAIMLSATGVYIARATLSPSIPLNVPQVLPDIIAVMPSRTFLRYEMVPFDLRLGKTDRPFLRRMTAVAEVFREGQRVMTVDGLDRLPLKRDFQHSRFAGNWPLTYNAPPGTYLARLTVQSPQWETPKTFESAFTIPPLRPLRMPPGYAVLTMEGGKSDREGKKIPPVSGPDLSSPENGIGWAKFMGADAFYYLVGQTAIWGKRLADEYPFSDWDRKNARKYARVARDAGLKFGAYVTAFKVIGDGWEQANYEYSTGYNSDKDRLVTLRHISLDDANRIQDLVALLKDLEADPLVDLIGFDYLRLGFGGYELVEELVRNLHVPVPPEYLEWTKEERMLWLARIVERRESPKIRYLFNWWRAHRTAETVRRILEEAGVTKPVFAFTLGWEMGHQHGQDPAMLVDAGVGINHIMLYESTREHVEVMKRQWPPYLARGNAMYLIGEMVDFNWVQNTLDPPGPQELYDRQMETFHKWFAVNADLGMFWHDLYRLFWGFQGPYSRMEWVLTGAAAFSHMRQAAGVLPVETNLMLPESAPRGADVPFSVEVRNQSPEDLEGLRLMLIDTSKDTFAKLGELGPFQLPAGSQTRFDNLRVRLPREDNEDRDNRYMVAVLVEKDGEKPMRAFDFAYVKALSPGEVRPSLDVAQ